VQVSGASLLVAAATVAAGLALAAPALARAEPVATAPEHSFGTGRAAAGSYWTPERIAAAPGLGIDAGGRVRTTRPGPAAITAGALRSVRVRNPARYPNRVHGKLLGTFRGLGDFACSATVVSSRSGSLLTTANQFTDESTPFDVDQLTLNIDASIATLYAPAEWPISTMRRGSPPRAAI